MHVELPGVETPLRIYRTGDLARWLPSGDIEFSGRVDHQMKIGSYRIEPGEIESVMNLYPEIRESLVVCEEANGQKYLVAYLVPQDVERFDQTAFIGFVRDRLPQYMVPTRGAVLASLPKTINGKIDRASLPKGADLAVLGSINDDDSQPTTELERQLVEVWKNVLQLPRVGIHDDFFHLGGSSLLVTRVIAQMSGQLKMVIPVRDFFANPTIYSMARQLEYLRGNVEGRVELSSRESISNLRAKLPQIRSLDISSHGARIANVYYPPVQQRDSKNHAVIMANSYGHEATRAFRNLQQLAVQLSQAGFDVIRFDYAGTGDSDGGIERLSFRQWTNDIRAVTDASRQLANVERVSVLGVRLGANLLAEAELSQIEHFVAWDPVLNGAGYLDGIKEMHAEETAGLNRYLKVRDLGREELLGYPWPFTLESDTTSLTWPTKRAIDAKRKCWIVTDSERAGMSQIQPTADWNVLTNNDEIYWGCLMYANSAFASPTTSRTITKLLNGEG